ncbi:MAG: hypothetical protein H6815_04995 [Phycisphaeraceae bacterium]|nr:hypothetical protein [Phycisphaerales bacterium]MCB9859792.1 hypothetical protein [Phycisphaeraceae bacterium]
MSSSTDSTSAHVAQFGPSHESDFVNPVRLWCIVAVALLMIVAHTTGWITAIQAYNAPAYQTQDMRFEILYASSATVVCMLTLELMMVFIRRARISLYIVLLPAAGMILAPIAVCILMREEISGYWYFNPSRSIWLTLESILGAMSFFVCVLVCSVVYLLYDANRWDGYGRRDDLQAVDKYVSATTFLAEAICAKCGYKPGPSPEIVRCPECDSDLFIHNSRARRLSSRPRIRTDSKLVRIFERPDLRVGCVVALLLSVLAQIALN